MEVFKANGIDIYFRPNQNGGGMHFGQDYVSVVSQRYGRVKKIYEFCSGPAFIGFSLLGAGLCEQLILSDIFAPVKESINKTIRENELSSATKFYEMKGVSSLPEHDIDLVVSNPPHFSKPVPWLNHIEQRVYFDNNWEIHKEFYANIKRKLAPNGIILLQENALGSCLNDFEEMIIEAGLTVKDTFFKSNNVGNDQIYYIEVMNN